MNDHRQLAKEIVAHARARGADEADVYIHEGRGLSLDYRLGKLERLEEAGSERLTLRLYKKGACAVSYSSDLSLVRLRALVDETLTLTDLADPHPANALPPPDLLGQSEVPLDLIDPGLSALTLEDKLEILARVEEAGRAQDARVTNIKDVGWRDDRSTVTVASSHGFVGSYDTTSMAFGAALVAEADGVKQIDRWWTSAHHLADLQTPESVGQTAAKRVVRKLGARPVRTQQVPVVFDPLMGAEMLRNVLACVQGQAVFRRSTVLADRLGAQLGATRVSIVDQPLLPRGPGSRPFDAEGVCSRPVTVLDEGRLVHFLTEEYSARRLGAHSSGHAVRAFGAVPTVGISNFQLLPGSARPDDIIASVERGLYLTHLYWVGFDPASGSWSRGAEGVWIERGELTHYVQEITVASNLVDMLAGIEVIGNDLEFHTAVSAPTFLIGRMTLSGQ